jgi:2,3-dihydroxybiphenyl 1,2-dioxygenase
MKGMRSRVALESLGYVGINAASLDDWERYAAGFLGMQPAERSGSALAFRMDERRQRLIVHRAAAEAEGAAYYGWEIGDAAALDALGAQLEEGGVAVSSMPRALADERRVAGGLVFNDPAGNRLEAFHGAEAAAEPFRPGRNISGFRTGALGMGHVVITVREYDAAFAFYQQLLGFRQTDYFNRPYRASFFHLNARHHSLALVDGEKNALHHLMVELLSLDDVGQAYDLVADEAIGVTMGRHSNDYVTSFYTHSPSGFMVEYGWGGRSLDTATWKPSELTVGPSLWGHERRWLPAALKEEAKAMRVRAAQAGLRAPVQVVEGNYQVGR